MVASSQTRSFQVGSASVWSTGGTGRSHQDTSYFDIFIIIIHTLCTDVFPISSSISDSNNTQLGLLAPQTTGPASQSTNRIVLATQLSVLKSQSEHFFFNIYTKRQHIHKHQWLQRQTNTKTQKVNFCTLFSLKSIKICSVGKNFSTYG